MLFYLIPGAIAVIACFFNPYAGGADVLVLMCLLLSLFCYIGAESRTNKKITKVLKITMEDEEEQTQAYSNTRMGRILSFGVMFFGAVYAAIFTFLLPEKIADVPFALAESLYGVSAICSIACGVMMMATFEKSREKNAPDIHNGQEARKMLENNRRFTTSGLSLGPAPEKPAKNKNKNRNATDTPNAQQATPNQAGTQPTFANIDPSNPDQQALLQQMLLQQQQLMQMAFGQQGQQAQTQEQPAPQQPQQSAKPRRRQAKLDVEEQYDRHNGGKIPKNASTRDKLQESASPQSQSTPVDPLKIKVTESGATQKDSSKQSHSFTATTSSSSPKKAKIDATIPKDIAADIASRMLGLDKEAALKNSQSIDIISGFLFSTPDGSKKVLIAGNGQTYQGDSSKTVPALVEEFRKQLQR